MIPFVNKFLVICWYKLVNVLLGTGGNRGGTTPKICYTLHTNLLIVFKCHRNSFTGFGSVLTLKRREWFVVTTPIQGLFNDDSLTAKVT
jgi:hypothetical protein